MKKLGWILAIAWWLCFLTGLFLNAHFGFKWVSTVDVLLTFALLIAFSVWHAIERFRSGPGESRWVIGRDGGLPPGIARVLNEDTKVILVGVSHKLEVRHRRAFGLQTPLNIRR